LDIEQSKGGATVFKVGIQFFWPPPFAYLGGGHETECCTFHYCNHDV